MEKSVEYTKELLVLKELIESTCSTNLKLYFITRLKIEGIKKGAKVKDKYSFKAYRIDVDDEIRGYLYDLSIEQLDKVARKGLSLIEYDPISDDTEHLFSYKLKSDTSSFYDVVINQLNRECDGIKSLEDIISNNEDLWAYCIEFRNQETDKVVYTFRKILSGKVAIDEKDDTSVKFMKRAIRTLFSPETAQLTLLKGESVILDSQIDCIYYDDMFYVIKKLPFEQIVGLQEEYHDKAMEVYGAIKDSEVIAGLDTMTHIVEGSPALHRRLVKIAKTGGLELLKEKSAVSKMRRISKKYGKKLKVIDGKPSVEDKDDLDLIIRLLCDYYKTGEMSGKSYGTYSGIEVKVEKS